MSVFEMNSICRLCLKVDVKVYKLGNTRHRDFIEKIFKMKHFNCVPTEDDCVCYICMALLSKTSDFIQMVWNAQSLILKLSITTDLITKSMLKYNIERNKYGLDLITLGKKSLFYVNVYPFINKNIPMEIYNKTQKIRKDDVINKNSATAQVEQVQEQKKTCNINNDCDKNKNNFIEISSSSDEEIEIGDKNRHDSEKNVCDPLKKDTKSKLKHTTDNNVAAPEDPMAVLQITDAIANEPESEYFSESSSSSKKQKRRPKDGRDEDYQPDSTSHSEDSDFDSFDDMGKPIKRPKADYRIYPRKCDHCDYEVPKRSEHYRHYIFDHTNIKYPYAHEKTHPCSICGKLLAKTKINFHEKKHINIKIQCTDCPKVFPNTTSFNRHRLNVHPKRTYTCDYCSKVFKRRPDIMLHIRIHTGEKPFKCHICEASFAHSGNRTIHIRSAHQNYRYVPKKKLKQAGKVRRNKKKYLSDTEIETSDDESIQRKCNIRKKKHTNKKDYHLKKEIKKKTQKTKHKRDRKLKNNDDADTEMIFEDENENQKDKNCTKNKSEQIQNVGNNNIEIDLGFENTSEYQKSKNNSLNQTQEETESDDENLAEKRRRKIETARKQVTETDTEI